MSTLKANESMEAFILTRGPSTHVQAADDVANGLADSLLAEAPVGAELTSIALFIDEESTQARFCLLDAILGNQAKRLCTVCIFVVGILQMYVRKVCGCTMACLATARVRCTL